MMKTYKDYLPIFFFFLLSFIIVLPLLSPGYILTLDIIPTPKYNWPVFFSNNFFFDSIIGVFSFIIPYYWLQKAFLFLIFFLSGYGMYRLIPVNNILARVFGGLVYMVNPFVYERIMAGHWNYLLAYAIFPFFVAVLMSFCVKPNFRKALILSLFVTVILNIVIHYSLILAFFLIAYFMVYALVGEVKIADTLKYGGVFLGFLILFNLNWIVSYFLGNLEAGMAVAGFSTNDLIAFQSVPDKNFGLIFNLLSGYGFWPEVYDYFVSVKNIIFFWPVISVIFILLTVWGLIQSFRKRFEAYQPLVFVLIIFFIISLDLAAGIALESFAPAVSALYQKFSLLRGFREPQKLVGCLFFCYAFFGSFALWDIAQRLKNKIVNNIFLIVMIILPFVYTPVIFRGFWGQLKPVFYPVSWEKADKILMEDKDNFQVVFFPWHQYLKLKFNNNLVVANPAFYYFHKPVLSSKNYETKFLKSHDVRPDALHVEGLIKMQTEGKNLLDQEVESAPMWGSDLSVIGVKYIILAKEDDWEKYSYLLSSPEFEKVFEDDTLILLKNTAFTPPDQTVSSL